MHATTANGIGQVRVAHVSKRPTPPRSLTVAALTGRFLAVFLGLFLLGGSLVLGQQPGGDDSGPAKPKPAEKPAAKSLEDLLTAALRSNPDIRVAEAKLREAEAELNRTRLQTTQKVVTLFRGLEAQNAVVQSAEAEAQRVTQLQITGAVPSSSVEPTRQRALQAKAKLSEIEAELVYLTGQQPAGAARAPAEEQAERTFYAASMVLAQRALLAQEEAKQATAVRGTVADNIRKMMNTPIKARYKNKHYLAIVQSIQDMFPEVRFQIGQVTPVLDAIELDLGDQVPVGAVLQALSDVITDLRFVVREYGILVTVQGNLPPGAVLLHDFWKATPEKETPASGNKNPPPDGVEGVVEAFDTKSGFLTINVGSNKGLAKDHTLEVYRLQPKPKYLGTIRILDVLADKAVAQPVGRPLDKIQPGDRVAGKVQHK